MMLYSFSILLFESNILRYIFVVKLLNIMKKHVLLIVCFLISLLFTDCTSRKSQVSSGYKLFDGKIENLFIIVNLPNDNNYSKKIAENLKEQMEVYGIKCNYYIIKKLDLASNDDINAMAIKEGASHILTLEKTFEHQSEGEIVGPRKLVSLSVLLYNMQKREKQYLTFLDQDLRLVKNANQAKNDAKLIVSDFNNNNLF